MPTALETITGIDLKISLDLIFIIVSLPDTWCFTSWIPEAEEDFLEDWNRKKYYHAEFDCLTLKNIIFILKEKCSWYHFSSFVYYLCKINNYLYHKKTIKKFVNEKNVSVSNILWCTHLSIKIESAYYHEELLILFHFLALTNKKQTSFSPTI